VKIIDKLKELLSQNGLFDSDIEKIMAAEMSDPTHSNMLGRWNEDESAYPGIMINILWASVRYRTLEYIKENQPQAWYRPAFEDDNALWQTPEGKAIKMGVKLHDIPPELVDHVNPNEWDIIPNMEGKFTIVDQSIQTQIGSGDGDDCENYKKLILATGGKL